MPAEGSAFYLGEISYKLACCGKARPEDQHLLGRASGFKPDACSFDTGTAGDGGDDYVWHRESQLNYLAYRTRGSVDRLI